MSVRLPKIVLNEIKDPYIRENFRQLIDYIRRLDETNGTSADDDTGGVTQELRTGFLLSGEGDPSVEDGDEGDFFIDTDTDELYGPKQDNNWGDPVTLGGSTVGDGVGLTTLNISVVNATTNYSIATTDDMVLCDASGGAFSVYLPDATGTDMDGKVIRIKKIDNSFTAITIVPSGSQTIDGASTKKLCTRYDQYTLVSDGSNWHVVSHTYPKGWVAFTPTLSWTSNVSVNSAFWRRDGDEIVCEYTVGLNGNAPAGALTATIPNSSSWTINTGSVGSTSRWIVGANGYSSHATQGNIPIWTQYSSATTVAPITFATNTGANPQWLGGAASVSNAAQGTWQNGNIIQFGCRVPITQLEA